MLQSARRAPVALRTLHFASSQARSTSLKILRSVTPRRETPRDVSAFRKFSSLSCRFQEAVAEREQSENAPQQYTRFEELAENNIVHPVVIDTITQQMDIHEMTEVQKMTLNECLDGSDVVAQAKTGTGKTLAFLLPIIQRLLRRDPQLGQRQSRLRPRSEVDIQALIVSPTRELAEQIAAEAARLVHNTSIKVQTAVGGTQKRMHLSMMQRQGCHLLIGTPGRVNDLLSDRSSGVKLDNIDTFVLDEADRLLDIGFAPAIEEMQSYMPRREEQSRQTLMFSATVPKSVISLVRQTMRPDFKFVRTVDPDEAPTHERIPQNVVFLNGLQNQMPVILEIAKRAIEAHKQDPANNLPFKAIVYFGATTQVDMAYEVFNHLQDPARPQGRNWGSHPLSPCRIVRMNGGLSQQRRTQETAAFRRSESAILFSTDVTARGMDFPNVSHVIQMGMPRSPDDYVHRIGRTGRAGKPGEGWLVLNEDEKYDYQRQFSHKGIKMQTKSLESASLNMRESAKLSADVAKMLQMIEAGVKAVPFDVKSSVYRSLLGVLQQQFPGRSKQDQIDMMNDLAKYGWGMPRPPPLPSGLVQKLGFDRVRGIDIEDPRDNRDSRDFRGSSRGLYGDRDERPGRFNAGRSRFDDNDPFRRGGKGVFGGTNGGSGGRRRDAFGEY